MAVQDASQAMDLLQHEMFPAVLAGQEMSRMTGLEFLAKVSDIHPFVSSARITRTGMAPAIPIV